MSLELFANTPNPSSPSTPWTVLSGALTDVATAVTFLDGSVFPIAVSGVSQYRILIEDEIIIVTNSSGDDATIARGAEGTTAAAHADGASVYHIVTAAAVGNLSYISSTATQTANTVLAGPTTGSAAAPSFRALVAADILDISATYVPITRTVNGHALSGNVSVSASDVGLGSVENAAASGLYVPLSRTVNSKALSSDISLTASDVGAEVPLTFSTGLTRTVNTVTVNTSQNIATLSNLTTDGLVTTSGGVGTLGVTAPGTGVLTALGVNVGSAGAFVAFNGALGTPSSGTLTSATGLPISTGVSGLGTGVATFLATPSSANLAAAVTDETGSGALVFATSPTLVTPTLGVASATSLSVPNGSASSLGLKGATSGFGLYFGTTGVHIATSGVTRMSVLDDGVGVATIGLTFGANTVSHDIRLIRDASGVLAQRDSATAQTLRIYETYTDASNYARLAFVTAAGDYVITPQAAGTGTLRGLQLATSAGKLGFYGMTAIAQAVLATGAAHTVDDVITAMQNLGLVKQS